ARSLVGKVDVIYIPIDNTVATAAESVIQVGLDNQLPVFAGDTDTVKRGAIATLSFNYYDIGRQTGQMALRVFGGEKPGDMPVEMAEKLELSLNLSAAKAMGVIIPESVVSRADEVFETF
ncbi:MAG: ABC transporter permease, partial [Pseudanabaenales cyanobacterium]|nr:ABC transporter permease [Pseudanabaenales cyanobacterium]